MFRFILFTVLLATVSAAPTLPQAATIGSSDIPTPLSISTTSDERISSSSSSSTTLSSTSPIIRPPAISAKSLSTISEIRTPASTAKLTQWVAPPYVSSIAAAAPILSPLQVSAYAYAVPALGSLELAAAPSTYSIEQHGYRIIY